MSNQQFDATTGSINPTEGQIGYEKSNKDVAADEAKKLGQNAQESGKQVAGTAKDEAQQLASEAKGQAQDLFRQVRSEASDQVSSQQTRLAEGLRVISGDLDKMSQAADGSTATGLVSQAAGQVGQIANWLERREPADLLDEARRYARRNPGTFLIGAALVGFLGGRLTRGLQADARHDQARFGGQRRGYDDGRRGYAEYESSGYGYADRGAASGYGTTYPAYEEGGAYDRPQGLAHGGGYTQQPAGGVSYEEQPRPASDSPYTAEQRGDRPGDLNR
ncbi:hypothetical protein [Mobilicoccus massiliensis]|uniref:hypothetical protein n=1 Tax=Mobilicoccus massiliensis TaxID=1522310 RepID=UPI000694720B|nr:hypothetical protein [Mobilicoccus massiliensis]